HARHVGGVEGADLEERVRVEQARDPLARVERARGPAARQPLGPAHGARGRAPGVEVLHPLVPGHGGALYQPLAIPEALGYTAEARFHPTRIRRPLAMKHRQVYRTELTPVSFLVRNAYVFPDKTAVVHGARRYTYRQLGERVNRLASALRAAGMQKHDRVAFLCPNIPPMLEAHYGVPAAGGVLVAINTRLSSDEIGYILQHSGSTFLFVDAELEHLVKP